MPGRILTANDIDVDRVVSAQAVVVGSGAGGATTANLLCEAGKDVVVLEEGSHQTTENFSGDIPELMGRLYRDGGLTPIFGKPNIAYAEGKCLGGSTVINGSLFMRPPEPLLRDWSERLRLPRMGAGDLGPFFDRVEADLNVATQPDRSANRASWRMVEGAAKLGWRSEDAPRAQATCKNSNRCPTGCPTGAKQSMLVSYLPEAVAKGAEILCDTRVERIVIDRGRATGVEAAIGVAGGVRRITIRADDVFICGGPMQTPYLLLGSGFKRNVGDSLRIHLNLKVVAVFPDDIDPAFGTIMTAQVKEFEDNDLYIGSSTFDFVYLALTLAPHGTPVVEEVMEDWRRAGIYVAQIKASGQGRIRRSALVDRPLPSYALTAGDMENIRFAILRVCEVLLSAGAEKVYLPIAGSWPVRSMEDAKRIAEGKIDPRSLDLLSVHGMGSCPMGATASMSALDPFGRVWDVRNLHVNDASMLPGATGVSPQLTTMAVAMRNVTAFLDTRAGVQ